MAAVIMLAVTAFSENRKRAGEAKAKKRARQFEASIRAEDKKERDDRISRQERAGRANLVQTTPQGALNPVNSARQRLTASG